MSEIRPYWKQNAGAVRLFYTLPSEQVVSDEYVDNFLKSKLNVSDNDLIDVTIQAATDDSERTTSRAYITRNITAEYDYVYDKVNLTIAPVSSVLGVTAVDPVTASAYPLTTADYTVVGDEEPYLIVKSYAGYRLNVAYSAGYGTGASAMPSWVKDAVCSRIAYKYAMQPMDMAMYERRFNDAEARHKFYVSP